MTAGLSSRADARSPIGEERAGPDFVTIVLIALPAVLILLAGWSHRWTSDDGFINVRVVQQIFDGNGPVYNVGERVEVGTSTAWLFLLVIAHGMFFWLPIEWAAVGLGLATTVAAVVLAQVAALRAYAVRRVIPFGILAFIALPPVWDFTTSGLETGLSLLWIAASQYFIVSATRTRRLSARVVAATTIGLGPLVRPDFVAMAAVFLLMMFVVTEPNTRGEILKCAIAAITIPLLYEVFRIAYYGALLPNTAFAKEAGRTNWPQGERYLSDFSRPYKLWLILILLAVVFAFVTRGMPRGSRLVLATPAVAGLVDGFFVVRAGGDHMHGRLLLPTLFAIVLPLAAIPLRPLSMSAVALLALWAIVPLWSGGPAYDGLGPDKIANERTVWVRDSDHHPVTIDDFRKERIRLFSSWGNDAHDRAANGERTMVLQSLKEPAVVVPLADAVSYPSVIGVGPIGMVGVAAGTDVYVADELSLADPIGARIEIGQRGRPGHEKLLPVAWFIARFADPHAVIPPDVASAATIEAARLALECSPARDLLARAREPLTFARVATNVREAFTGYTTRINRDPVQAAKSCD